MTPATLTACAALLLLPSAACLTDFEADDDEYAVASASQEAKRSSASNSRDVGVVNVACKNIEFLVSHNNDDDDKNGKADKRERRKNAQEDNLREFVFDYGEADRVYVFQPTGLGKRVRAYSDRAGTPFDFSVPHATSAEKPLRMYIEGVLPSPSIGDVIFELTYYAGEYPLCGPAAYGTVVGVSVEFNAESKGIKTYKNGTTGYGADFTKKRNMLITGTAAAKATVTLPLPGTWHYDGAGTFAPANKPKTVFTAGEAFTPVATRDRHRVFFSIAAGGMSVEGRTPVNLTAPRAVHTVRGAGCVRRRFNTTTGWITAKRRQLSLFDECVKYRMLDQWGDKLTKNTAYAGRMPQIRENIGNVLKSPIPAMQTVIDNSLKWTNAWKDKPQGEFTDKLRVARIHTNHLIVFINKTQRILHTQLRDAASTGELFNLRNANSNPTTHDWYLSVNGRAEKRVTANTFTVTRSALSRNGAKIKLRSRYRVVLLPR